MSATEFGTRLDSIRSSLQQAAQRVGRDDEVTLVAVSKTVEVDSIRAAIDAGQRVFGENRVQEAVAKIEALTGVSEPITWHLLGHVQTNKVKAAVGRFACVESVDSPRLAAELDRRAHEAGITLPILLEVNVGGETSKSGFSAETLEREAEAILNLPSLFVQGLMTVAPYADDPEDVRWVFRRLRELRDSIRDRYITDGFTHLSMGMSNDYAVAIEEGATIVRIGRALFGDRPTAPRMRQT
jgi:pyridoxal phosphate enzyme (YggS family)